MHLTGIVETLMMNTSTPIDEDGDRHELRLHRPQRRATSPLARGVGSAIIRDLEKQMAEEHRPIWENKAYWTAGPSCATATGTSGCTASGCAQFFSEDWTAAADG